MGYSDPALPPRWESRSTQSVFARDGSLLPCSYADARAPDDVIAIEGNIQNGLCECQSADTAQACASLGTSVGSQSGGGSSTCLVVDCGKKGLTFVPTIPAATTKLDLQNNPNLKEVKFNTFGLNKLSWIYIQGMRVQRSFSARALSAISTCNNAARR